MTPKGSDLQATDLVEVSTLVGGSYVTKSVTGQDIIDAAAGGGGVTDVTATAPIVSTGGTTPDISIDQADGTQDGYLSIADWNTFNDKQNGLTLTTTGTSGPATFIADTLNIPQYSGGGGASGIHAVLQPATGQLVGPTIGGLGTQTLTATANRLVAVPFIPANTFTSQSLQVNITTLALLANVRILIYSNLNAIPNTKLYESANLDCSTTGPKIATTSFTFNAGTTYWLCLHSSSNPAMTSIPIGNLLSFNVLSPSSLISSYIYNITFGSAPTTLGTPIPSSTNVPLVSITAA
jgi:hypothetical protein